MLSIYALKFVTLRENAYFCTKLQKKVDTDLIAAIAGGLLAVFIGWAERAAAGKTRKGKPAAR
ncbi:MAG: hypothetical protein K2I04_02175, partial [Muribaculaceae bacterium]|nr:hypothetical protein [Muribaculaceae bacterium]